MMPPSDCSSISLYLSSLKSPRSGSASEQSPSPAILLKTTRFERADSSSFAASTASSFLAEELILLCQLGLRRSSAAFLALRLP